MLRRIWERSVKTVSTFSDDSSRKPKVAAAWGLSLVLGLSGAIAFTLSATTPAVAQIDNSRLSLFLNRNEDESFSTFLRRAEAIARTGVQQTFDNDLLISEAVVTVVGENQGISVPIMVIEVTRAQWQERPDPQYWAVYYGSAPLLLNF